MGITKAVAKENGYDGPMKSLPVDVAQAIYKRQYWDAVRADELPESVRYAVFDGAVNSGVSQSVCGSSEPVARLLMARSGRARLQRLTRWMATSCSLQSWPSGCAL